MSPETATLQNEVQETDNPYGSIADHFAEVSGSLNDKQLTDRIDKELLANIVDGAAKGDFVPKPSAQETFDPHFNGSPDQIINLLWVAHAMKTVGNQNWVTTIPETHNLRETIVKLVDNPHFARAYPYALKMRSQELVAQRRNQEQQQGLVSPEDFKEAEVIEEIGERATESVILIDVNDIPKNTETPVVDVPVFDVPAVELQKPEETRSEEIKIGDEFTIYIPVIDPVTNETVGGRLQAERIKITGLQTGDNGNLMVRIENEAGIDTYIPVDLLTLKYKAERIKMLNFQYGGVEPTHGMTIEEKPQFVEPYAGLDEKVYIKGNGDSLLEGTVKGYYNEGDLNYSPTYGQFAAIELSSGEEVGVYINEITKAMQESARRRIFKTPEKSINK